MTLLTHKGWFGICPVYLGDVDAAVPLVVARQSGLEPLLDLNIHLFQLVIILGRLIKPGYYPEWPVFFKRKIEPRLAGEKKR